MAFADTQPLTVTGQVLDEDREHGTTLLGRQDTAQALGGIAPELRELVQEQDPWLASVQECTSAAGSRTVHTSPGCRSSSFSLTAWKFGG